MLIDYLRTCADDVLAGKHCLELGCGIGAVGMAAAMRGAAEVLLTDMPQMQRLLQLSIASNIANFPTSTRVHRCASLALSPLPLIFSYKSEKSL